MGGQRSIKRCPVHNSRSRTFCKVCKRLICDDCEECEDHEFQASKKFIDGYRNDILQMVGQHKLNALQVSKGFTAELELTKRDASQLIKAAKDVKQRIINSEAGREGDKVLITEAINYLRGVQEKAFTSALHGAVETAIHVLDIDEDINIEIKNHKKILREMKNDLKWHRATMKKLKMKLEWLGKIVSGVVEDVPGDSTKVYKVDEEVELAMSLCFVNNIMHTIQEKPQMQPSIVKSNCVIDDSSSSINDYSDTNNNHYAKQAMPIVHQKASYCSRTCKVKGIPFQAIKTKSCIRNNLELPGVGGAVFTEMIDIGLGVKVSKPIIVEKHFKCGENIMCSLSHNGVIAVSSGFYSNCSVQLTDLKDGRQVEFEVENITNTGFYDDALVMLTMYKPLRHSNVEKVFEKMSVSALKEIKGDDVRPFADVTHLNTSRMLLYAAVDGTPYEYCVDTMESTKIPIEHKICSFASLFGTGFGVKGAFVRADTDCLASSISDTNEVDAFLEYDTGCNWLNVVIPSQSNPSNLSSAMKIFRNGMFYVRACGKLIEDPIQFGQWVPLVEVQQTVFLAYDPNKVQWCLIKIVVP